MGKGSETCMVPRCNRDAKTAGMCPACRLAAAKAVKSGLLTWEKLIDGGWCTAGPLRGRVGAFAASLGELGIDAGATAEPEAPAEPAPSRKARRSPPVERTAPADVDPRPSSGRLMQRGR